MRVRERQRELARMRADPNSPLAYAAVSKEER